MHWAQEIVQLSTVLGRQVSMVGVSTDCVIDEGVVFGFSRVCRLGLYSRQGALVLVGTVPVRNVG